MANRYYGVIPNTPENKRILDITMALDARRNVTGEPTYLWKVPSPNERPTLKGSGYTNDPAPRILGGGILQEMDEREPMRRPRGMVSPYTQPPNEYVLAGTRPSYPYYNSVELDTINRKTLKGGVMDLNDLEELRRMGYRPKKDNLYMPKLDPSKINPEVVAYANAKREMERAKYRAKKLKAKEEIDGSGIFTEAGKAAAKKAAKEAGKAAAKAAKEAAKAGLKAAKIAAKAAAKAAKEAAKLAAAAAKAGAKGVVAIAGNKEVQEVVGQIVADKDVQKLVIDQITNLAKPKNKPDASVEKPVDDEEEEEEEEDEDEVTGGRIKRKSPKGKGKTDGRAKRAAIVKKVMQEKGLKMIEASKFVKVHKLY